MNTVPGTVRRDGGAAWVEVGTGRVDVAFDPAIEEGRQVVVGVRPEHLSIGAGPLAATVRAIEWLGHERHVYCDVHGTSLIVRDTLAGGGDARPGDEVTMRASPDAVHLFDVETTERLN
jgi:ABC-type sugar transport system ATPase subunit